MREIAWFSCGAASAVVAKIATNAIPVYCDTLASEHPDNKRFMTDVARWIGREITIISSSKYSTIEEVADATKYMAGVNGARCTTEMKKLPRREFQEPDDIHMFGFTADEPKRIADFKERNPELHLRFVLADQGITKEDCFEILTEAGIALPVMYGLGFKNNNCLGCFKATSIKYWRNVKLHFPEVFERRAEQSRRLGVRLTRFKGERIFIDEIPSDAPDDEMENISCGPECGSPVEAIGK